MLNIYVEAHQNLVRLDVNCFLECNQIICVSDLKKLSWSKHLFTFFRVASWYLMIQRSNPVRNTRFIYTHTQTHTPTSNADNRKPAEVLKVKGKQTVQRRHRHTDRLNSAIGHKQKSVCVHLDTLPSNTIRVRMKHHVEQMKRGRGGLRQRDLHASSRGLLV